MSRTVSIRKISRVKKSEIAKFEELTMRDIFLDYENILSLNEAEYLSEGYSSLQKWLTRVNTVDGHILYIAHTKILVNCSDSLLAMSIEKRIRNYVACTYRDITRLAGQILLASEVGIEKDREMNFTIPNKERGVHIFFFDDMD